MTATADIVVVGGGIVGCSVVHHLAEALPRDAHIVLLDRGAIAGGTSGACMGHLMVTPDDAQHYALTAGSVRLWRALHERLDGFDYNPTGALYLADGPEDLPLLRQLQQRFEACGERAEMLDGLQLREVEPGLAADLPGGLYFEGDGVLLPMYAAAAFLRGAARQAVRLDVRPNTEVTGIDVERGRIRGVRTAGGGIATPRVVLAAGVWTPDLGRLAGVPSLPIVPRAGNLAITAHHTSPIRTQLLEAAYLRVAHGAAQADPLRTDQDRGAHAVNMQPQSHGGCLIGSTRRFCGMTRMVDRELLHTSLARAARYVPGLRLAPVVRTWAGLRPYSLDKQPLIGPWPGVEGLWLASGHEGLGITLAPITGLLLAQQLTGAAPAIDVQPYLPSRFVA